MVIIINGNERFIENKNEELKKILKNTCIELIDCYNFEEIKEKMVEIRENYTRVLNNLQKDY